MSTKLSLIICTKDRGEALRRCLARIDQPELSCVNGELILVDNGSSDNTPEVLAHFKNTAKIKVLIKNEPKPGLGRARNTGLKISSGEIVIFTDDDCYLEQGYFRKALAAFSKGSYQYCGGRILLHDKTDDFYGCNFNESFEIIPPFSFLPAGKIQGANMVVSRKVFDRIGLFDPDLGAGTPFRCEDIDFCAKASWAGFTGAHVPELVVCHHHGRKPGKVIANLCLANDYARGAYYMKYLFKGHFSYLKNWIKTTYKSPNINFRAELRGASYYLINKLGLFKSRKLEI